MAVLDREVAEAVALFDKGEVENAADRLDALVGRMPEHREARLWACRVSFKRSRYEEAASYLRPLDPTLPDELVMWGRIDEKFHRYDRASAAWRMLQSRHPDHAEARMSLEALAEKRRVEWAIPDLDLSLSADRNVVTAVAEKIISTKLSSEPWWRPEFASSPPPAHQHHFDRLASYVERHSFMRYNRSASSIVPWLAANIELTDSVVVEIGCGTGSTTAVLAQCCRSVHGYDIDPGVVGVCLTRLEAMGLENASAVAHEPARLQEAVMAEHSPESADVVMLYAVVEHQTWSERAEALENAWTLLRPGGVLAVIEAPNRLTYFDWHTSQIPFFQQLPIELQARYYERSRLDGFVSTMRSAAVDGGDEALQEALQRWGQSVSFHDFEVVFGDLSELVLSDGSHPLVERYKPAIERRGEQALRAFLDSEGIEVPPGFDRATIDVLLQKPSA